MIVGDHRVNGDGVCDESFQFLWTSSNGVDWTIVPDTGTDAFLTGLVWVGDAYVGYGSPRTHVTGDLAGVKEFGDAESSLGLMATSDLSSWAPIELDLSVLPDDVIVDPASATSGNSGSQMAGLLPSPDGTVIFSFPLLRSISNLRVALEAGLPDIGALRRLLDEEGLFTTASIEEDLDRLDVDFPLDDGEATRLLSFYGGYQESAGRLIVEHTNAGRWATIYLED